MTIKTSHCSRIFTDASEPNIGANIWRWRREVVSVYVVRMLLSNDVSHRLITSSAYEPVEK